MRGEGAKDEERDEMEREGNQARRVVGKVRGQQKGMVDVNAEMPDEVNNGRMERKGEKSR